MNLLAFDTSTERLSVAVRAAQGPLLAHEGAGGAQASGTLLPVIQALLDRAGLRLSELDAIVFGRGPGSFTGLRTACSVAQGLGFGAGVALLPVDTLLAVAEQARAQSGLTRMAAVLDARMGEVYFGHYEHLAGAWQVRRAPALGRPENVAVPDGWCLAGNAHAVHGERLGAAAAQVECLPTAQALIALAPVLRAAGHLVIAEAALPLYLRDKVAQTTEERAAARAEAAAVPGRGAHP